jgi:hypothetical protein
LFLIKLIDIRFFSIIRKDSNGGAEEKTMEEYKQEVGSLNRGATTLRN